MRAVVLWVGLTSAWWWSAASASPAGLHPSTTEDDRAISVGTWDVVAVEMNGKTVDPELVTLLRVTYRADGSWSVLFRSLPLVDGISTNDQDAEPKTFEMETLAREPAKPARYSGIYRLEGDSRLLCFVEEGNPRPDGFTAPKGSGRVLVKLRRAAGDGRISGIGGPAGHAAACRCRTSRSGCSNRRTGW